MIRLKAYPKQHPGIKIEDCGLLFLGTPHSGTTLADWNSFLLGIAAVTGIRADLIKELRSFNGFGVEAKEAFNSIIPRPPYYCICETLGVNIGGIVSLVSAINTSRSVQLAELKVPNNGFNLGLLKEGCHTRFCRVERKSSIPHARCGSQTDV